ncbi:putative Tetratricopeptide repeat protein 1 [Seiridium cardinale]|uniref:Tetratricopeptide repeat protein 1 n=1 Tax=Seiridium cardinale TaxID=138064 RepID=A0ABR2Y053_9PEZI
MATARNGHLNGVPLSKRFSDIPASVDVPFQGGQEDEAIEISLGALNEDPTELCEMLENESAARTYWMTVAIAYAKHSNIDNAIEMLIRGGNAMQSNNPKEKLSMVSALCWMYLWKSREAPRVAPDAALASEAKTKEYYLNQATQSLNEALRINPAFPPLFLARGVIYLLRASLVSPSKASGPTTLDPEKSDLLRNALKCFEDAIRVSHGKNVLALMGKARALFSLAKYAEACALYQDVLRKMPDMVDPDPRIGIGCCFWQLGFKDDAKQAWERSLEINPESKIANILLGLYYLDSSAKVPTNSPEFIRLYKKAMTEFTQKSFKMDKNQPLTCATFAGYFLSRKQLSNVESLSNKALQYTDVNNIASDSWYLLARKEHVDGNFEKATDYYRRADEARGGLERGYLPAKFGVAQLSVLNNDLGEAKLRLEKMIQQSKNYEAMVLMGTLYAEEVFANQYAAVKEDKTMEMTKAIQYLENVRGAWKDPKRNQSPDSSVLLNLARLYENDQPTKALDCLQQVEQLELDQIPASEHPADIEDPVAAKNALRKNLPPQLLNNIGCFYSQAEKHDSASEMFEAALGACIRISEKGDDLDTDALVTTISFNLGRSYEAQGRTDEAIEVYERLVSRHSDYTDAQARLAYIKLRRNPNKEGPDAVAKLYQDSPSDLEVRALYGWYLGKVQSRKRPANVNDDPELRHYKHTLQQYDKHDRYALVGMGNLYMMAAREMRRETDQEKQKRSSMYSRAVEFFEKALQLDPKNAYAAQGIAIALVEDKKDMKSALPIFLKIRDTIKDAHVFVNLGHIYAELRQFSKAIESYELALSKESKANDTGILSCIGRTWLNKARHDKDMEAYKTALDYAKKALNIAPDQVHFKFNVAFVQIQQVQAISKVPEAQRTSLHLDDAMEELEAAIKTLEEIAAHPQPPYPKSDLEQRASFAKTQRNQLSREIEKQKEYEEKNKEKLAAAMEQRQAEMKRREAEREKAMAAERERQEKLRKEREEIAARDLELAKQRIEEDKSRHEAEMTTDSETGEKVKRKKKVRVRSEGQPKKSRPRKKKGEDDESGTDGEEQPKKKRRLTKKETKPNNKYKSAEIIVDSDDSGDDLERAERAISAVSDRSEADNKSRAGSDDEDRMELDNGAGGEDDEATGTTRRRARRGRVLDDSDEDEDEGGAEPSADKSDGEDDEPAKAADTSMADIVGDDDDDE